MSGYLARLAARSMAPIPGAAAANLPPPFPPQPPPGGQGLAGIGWRTQEPGDRASASPASEPESEPPDREADWIAAPHLQITAPGQHGEPQVGPAVERPADRGPVPSPSASPEDRGPVPSPWASAKGRHAEPVDMPRREGRPFADSSGLGHQEYPAREQPGAPPAHVEPQPRAGPHTASVPGQPSSSGPEVEDSDAHAAPDANRPSPAPRARPGVPRPEPDRPHASAPGEDRDGVTGRSEPVPDDVRIDEPEIVAAVPTAPPAGPVPGRPEPQETLDRPAPQPGPIDVQIGTVEIMAEPAPPAVQEPRRPDRPGLEQYSRLRSYEWDDWRE